LFDNRKKLGHNAKEEKRLSVSEHSVLKEYLDLKEQETAGNYVIRR
jgi:hypothetical protein